MTNDDIAGPGTRELLLKRFIFRCHGKLYVYTSSISGSIFSNSSDEDIREDVDQLVLVFKIQCFWRTKTDVFMNQI